MKCTILLACLGVFSMVSFAKDEPTWTFNHGDDANRLAVGQGSVVSVLGLNRIHATGTDLTLAVPLATNEVFGAAERPYLAFRYRMRSKITIGGLFFTTDTMDDLAPSYSKFPVVADGTWRHQIVDMRPYKHGHWKGTITSFRLDPINPSVPGDSVEVSRMGFFATPEEAERFLSAANDTEDYRQSAKLVNEQATVYVPAGTLKPGWRPEDYLMAAASLPPGDGELTVVRDGLPVPSFVNRRGYAFYVADRPGTYTLARGVSPVPLTPPQSAVLGLVASGRARPASHFSRERIRLAGWGIFRDRNFDVRRVKDFAACGLDMLISSPVDSGALAQELLSACDEEGIEVYLRTADMPKATGDAYDHHPSYQGAYLVDEPGTDAFPRWSAAAKAYREASGRRPFINLLPMYANAAQLKYGAHAAAIEYYDRDPQLYRKYCEAYCDQVDTDYICTDIYPLNWVKGLPQTYDGYVESINIIASVARERGREFWCCLQPFGWQANKRTSNAAEFRWQSYSLLSFGCRALHCWVYSGYKADFPSLTTMEGERTAAWYDARTVFREIRAISDVYCSYRNLGAFTHGCTDATPYLKMTGEYRDFKTIKSIRCASPLLVGCFAAKKGVGTAFTVVNMNDFLQNRSALAKLDLEGSRVVMWRKGVAETLSRGRDGLYDLPLECGEGIFVTVEPMDKDFRQLPLPGRPKRY